MQCDSGVQGDGIGGRPNGEGMKRLITWGKGGGERVCYGEWTGICS